MASKSQLKGTAVYVDDDLTEEERDVQRELRVRAREERKKGVDVWVGYRRIKIAGVLWVWDDGKLSKKE